ncbi:hypothetical protein COU62_03365 [Candidatus Pacearchaeota archaeon CG10_big_fil_rev_8_21_14_0_10_35_219]|nr:hypothetical protein [Candidatus Pacearchaeota archaeon]OIO42370.1 MAG: hypothetical protein AUJ63_03795 [Candidatus Pacearchaeota archaeon CG1_02_35_32]PIO07393.1 MAG: hypothetical protein COU62_03365 [Candidatus Pacearchaeota archaeon CG10_big_fil_rev_8_21_14_0_10_35_219]PIY81678.1 MAG: hypothetical protein COY79_01225 [Candidatus Pacearchaeota archaeon CG_4_10_14_0_8_um_filter_35_169]PIZ79495.1 MAG: hypothetical protein COY00_03690 [Candidatus Pacearchaeota archaeon CG_4_10_14_0_2_um_filt
MVNESFNGTISVEELLRGFWDFAPPGLASGLSFLVNLAAIAGILVIIYLVFLIIRALFRARAMKDLRTTMKNIVEMNVKLDRIIELLDKKHKKSKSGKNPKRRLKR